MDFPGVECLCDQAQPFRPHHSQPTLIRLAGIVSRMGDPRPLKEDNKSSQVLEKDLRGCDLESVSGEANKPKGPSSLHRSTSRVSVTGPSFCGV